MSEDKLSQRESVLRMQAANLVLKREENNSFREVTVAWAEAYGQGHSLVSPQVQC